MGKLKTDRLMLVSAVAVIIIVSIILTNYGGKTTSEAGEVTGAGITDTSIQFTGSTLYEETINKQAIEHVFSLNLEERRRLVVQGEFQQQVTIIVMSEMYYRIWQREREVTISMIYLKDKESIYKRFDVNEGAAGTYYFIIQSQNGNINGRIELIELAKL
jgi:hypothetical protein